jgi:hypothetical protein
VRTDAPAASQGLLPKYGLSHFPALTGHTGVPSFKLVKDRICVVRPACVDVGNATFDCGVNRCKTTLAFLQHAHRLLLTWKDFGQEGIDQLHARTIEISGVARHHRQVIDQGNRRDLFIQFVSGVWDP